MLIIKILNGQRTLYEEDKEVVTFLENFETRNKVMVTSHFPLDDTFQFPGSANHLHRGRVY